MVYDYKCNVCEYKYTKTNTMNDRAKGGKCPKCTSADTIKIMSAPMFKPAGGGHSNTIK